jgi:hypothetical protein
MTGELTLPKAGKCLASADRTKPVITPSPATFAFSGPFHHAAETPKELNEKLRPKAEFRQSSAEDVVTSADP